MKTVDFDFELPAELIAQHPVATRTGSRLLHLDGRSGTYLDRQFAEFPSLVKSADLLVFNDTKVIKARLLGRKETGGSVEVLIERVVPARDGTPGIQALAHVRASKSPKAGARLVFANQVEAEVLGRCDDLFELSFEQPVLEVLEQIGQVPLPPYIAHAPAHDDAERYQTVYARYDGSVAAPTAGLHFDQSLLAQLQAAGVGLAYVTLHVGAGTFRPVRDDDVSKHVMHREWCHVPDETVAAIAETRRRGGRVVAVGTTSLRTLESAVINGVLLAGSRDTDIFITPGYRFEVVDRLLTNFHLPRSTLMMLVSAFAGHANIMRAYRHAIESRYRFFSYGDAMLLERAAR